MSYCMEYSWEAEDESGQKFDLEFDIEYTATKGYAGSYHDPPEPPEAEIEEVHLTKITKRCILFQDKEMEVTEELKEYWSNRFLDEMLDDDAFHDELMDDAFHNELMDYAASYDE